MRGSRVKQLRREAVESGKRVRRNWIEGTLSGDEVRAHRKAYRPDSNPHNSENRRRRKMERERKAAA